MLTRYSRRRTKSRGFTLIESMAAVALLAFIGAGVWIVMDRCMMAAADSTQRMRAFEIARENMEKLLGSDSVNETSEFGTSEKYPDIRWQRSVEEFSGPTGSRMWVRAVCTAEYTNSAGENKNVELSHWLTELSKEQSDQLMQRKQMQEELLAQHIIETEELAAEYAGVDVETVREWVRDGMPTTADGGFLKPWLELYPAADGRPSEQQKQELFSRYPELAAVGPKAPGQRAAPGTIGPGGEITFPENMDAETRKMFEELLSRQPAQ